MIPIADFSPESYNYPLPDSRIAVFPADARDASRLLIRHKDSQLQEDTFKNIAQYLPADSHLFFNNSRVIPARLVFIKSSGSRIEIFCLRPVDPSDYAVSLSAAHSCVWECMVGNLKRFTSDSISAAFEVQERNLILRAEKLEKKGNIVLIRFSWENPEVSFAEILNIFGRTPLPPYIKRDPVDSDRERYQTIYSRLGGSVAAPTAGLHFTSGVFSSLAEKNISPHEVTLHVGAGTFQPVKASRIMDHEMHAECFLITPSLLNVLLSISGKTACVGTTTLRTLESLHWLGIKIMQEPNLTSNNLHLSQWEPYQMAAGYSRHQSLLSLKSWMENNDLKEVWATTSLMIVPGYRFRVIDSLITNFHQPKSTLLMLIAAFIGDSWKETYQYALDNGFRFLSYGDSSLLFSMDS